MDQALPTAGLYRRLMAMLYDAFLILAILFCVTMVYTFVVVAVSSDITSDISHVQDNDVLKELEPVPLGWPYYIVIAAVYLGFYCYFWKKTGQTLGMQAWKIKLYTTQDQPLSTQQCLLRLCFALVSIAALGLGYLTLLINRQTGCWHDRLSNTCIVDLSGQKISAP